MMVAIVVDKLPAAHTQTKPQLEILKRTVQLLKYKETLVLIPLAFYAGLEQTFITAEFNKVFDNFCNHTYMSL